MSNNNDCGLVYRSKYAWWKLVAAPFIIGLLMLLPDFSRFIGFIIMLSPLGYIFMFSPVCQFSLYADRIEIYYPFSFTRKKRVFQLIDIEEVVFGLLDEPSFVVRHNGTETRCYCQFDRLERNKIILELRKAGVDAYNNPSDYFTGL